MTRVDAKHDADVASSPRYIMREDRMWQPIETAPKDGTPFQARIPGHGDDNIIGWIDGLLDDSENDCGSWAFMDEQEPPDCWTDGICWWSNEDDAPSVRPTHWKPLLPAPEDSA